MKFAILLLMTVSAFSALTLVPRPKSVTDLNQSWTLAPSAVVHIVLGNSSGTIEGHGARLLENDIEKRFGLAVTVMRESDSWSGAGLTVFLGTRSTNAAINTICNSRGFALSDSTPGKNGYIIRTIAESINKIAIIGGCDANGALYGQGCFFQLLSKTHDSVKVSLATIDDYPTLDIRGEFVGRNPANLYADFYDDGDWDKYMRSRFNLVDLHGGWFGYDNAASVDTAEVRHMTTEAHGRGMQVWGVVQCKGDPADKLNAFRKLLSGGSDRLWASYDDLGADANAPALIRSLIAFADSAGLADSQVVIIAPMFDYDIIGGAWNRMILDSVPEAKNCQWVFTVDPSKPALDTAVSMGLTYKPTWWWNWPRFYEDRWATFSMGNAAYSSDPYMPVIPLSQCWRQRPVDYFESDTMIRNAERYINGTAYWNGGEETQAMHFGLWAWNPAGYNVKETRQYIWETVFGPDKTPLARAFDSTIFLLRALFDQSVSPFVLRDESDRPVANSMARTAAAYLDQLLTPGLTLLDTARYRRCYTVPMRNETRAAFELLGLTYTPGATLADDTPPLVRKVTVLRNPANTIQVLFSEPMDPAQATKSANFTISGITVTQASLGTDGCLLTLATSAMTPGSPYRLVMDNLADLNGNALGAATGIDFTCSTIPAYLLRVNFQPDTIPLKPGWGLTDDDVWCRNACYNASRGYGWTAWPGYAWWGTGSRNPLLNSYYNLDGAKTFRVRVTPGEYVIRAAVGGPNGWSKDTHWVVFGSDTLVRSTGSSYAILTDTVNTALDTFLNLTFYGCASYAVVMSNDGMDINDVADDGIWFTAAGSGKGGSRLIMTLIAAPNPFNPVVRFLLTKGIRHSGLKIYDCTGRLAGDLSSRLDGAGAVEWNARSRASGIYYAVLESRGKRLIRKLVLAK